MVVQYISPMPQNKRSKETSHIFARNKKAFADFEVLEKFEAGIQLNGAEVKSIREKKLNLKGGYVDVWGGEAWMYNVHISPYRYTHEKLDPTRKRKLLLHEKEIAKLASQLELKGLTIIPLEIFAKKGLIKVLIGICRGKKKYDRRAELKKRAQEREISQALKKYAQSR